jgi:hypothetical protein
MMMVMASYPDFFPYYSDLRTRTEKKLDSSPITFPRSYIIGFVNVSHSMPDKLMQDGN